MARSLYCRVPCGEVSGGETEGLLEDKGIRNIIYNFTIFYLECEGLKEDYPSTTKSTAL